MVLFLFITDKEALLYPLFCQTNIPHCGVKSKISKICMQERVHIAHTDISIDCLLILRYQRKVIELMRLGRV